MLFKFPHKSTVFSTDKSTHLRDFYRFRGLFSTFYHIKMWVLCLKIYVFPPSFYSFRGLKKKNPDHQLSGITTDIQRLPLQLFFIQTLLSVLEFHQICKTFSRRPRTIPPVGNFTLPQKVFICCATPKAC